MAILGGGGEFGRTLETITDKAGIAVVPIAETDSFSGLYELCRTGAVAAILPQWMAKTLPLDRFATVSPDELAILSRTLVVATNQRGKLWRPLIESASNKLVSVWRP